MFKETLNLVTPKGIIDHTLERVIAKLRAIECVNLEIIFIT